MPDESICRNCMAPSDYLYFNDGKKQTQIKCKICTSLSQIHPRHYNKAKFFCPHCLHSLFLWKQRKDVSIYKCDNDKCSHFETNKNKLNRLEKALRRTKSSQFKLRYQFREYHFTEEQLTHSAPMKNSLSSSILNIRNSLNTLCLALTFHVSLGISARKTAFILINVFGLRVSYQTVLNYTQQAAYYCHKFNLKYKGPVDNIQAGDETYIKITGKNAYTFFFISPERRKISAYHIDDSRDTLPATIAMKEAIRTADNKQHATLVTDGNPSYLAGIHFLNMSLKNHPIDHKKVIGLQNLDSESEQFRPFKQLIERLNRTYKFHIKAANGFNSKNGAVALTTLFVTYYNFMRPHSTLKYSVPVPIKALQNISTLQGKWAKILKMATDLDLAVAITGAQKEFDVAKLELEKAKLEKEVILLKAEANRGAALKEAEGRKAIADADDSLELRLKTQKEIMIGMAQALKDVNVPSAIIGGSGNSSGNPILDLFLMNQIKSLTGINPMGGSGK